VLGLQYQGTARGCMPAIHSSVGARSAGLKSGTELVANEVARKILEVSPGQGFEAVCQRISRQLVRD